MGALLNAGYCYDVGLGVRRNQAAALSWYLRAYHRGEVCGTNNIGTIWRDRGNLKQALTWSLRAATLGDHSAISKMPSISLRMNAIRVWS